MTQEQMNILVPRKLDEIERELGVEVLLAVESGSRAWGFASPDSDFDVRFIYKRPRNKYLQLNAARDVIELPIDDTWDVSGWDLDKTLRLLYKSNPTLYEWMNSPICYRRTGFSDRIAPLLEQCFSAKNMLFHYLSMARRNKKEQLSDETVQPKKYFYVLRPVLACLWIMEHRTAPPVLFSDLTAAMLPSQLSCTLEHLLDLKMNGPEKMRIEPIPELHNYLTDTIQRIEAFMEALPREEPRTWDRLNEFFIAELAE